MGGDHTGTPNDPATTPSTLNADPAARRAWNTALGMTRRGLTRYHKDLVGWASQARQMARPSHCPSLLCDVGRHALSAAWLGHASVLLRVGGLNILTDPVLFGRVGPSLGKLTFGINRVTPVPFNPADLPPIDVVLLSHAHFDHLDRRSLRALANPQTLVITARSTHRLVPRGFSRVVELDWECTFEHRGLRFSAVRPEHWGARYAIDGYRGFNAYVVQSEDHAVLFGGDSAHTDAFDTVGPVDLAVMGIGAYKPWNHHHASPDQAWSMFRRMGGRYLLPMHHKTFDLGEVDFHEPMTELMKHAAEESWRVVGSNPGDVWHMPSPQRTGPITDPAQATAKQSNFAE
jgi:L-ascorbate metabolism protein UlaG (beta-lactamase superfamily)